MALMTNPLISLADVSLSLRGNAGMVSILKHISLDIAAEETVALVGPSGSGKSSLLMVLGGLEQASSGHVGVLGEDLTEMDEDGLARFRRGRIGIVFQSFHLIPTLTALENVMMPLEIMGRSDAEGQARDALERVRLDHRLSHYPSQLSGGEQQRIALARAAVIRPKLLLADEPTGNLDQATGATIMEMLFDLRDTYGSTLVLVTHAPELAARCDRVLNLRDGVLELQSAAA